MLYLGIDQHRSQLTVNLRSEDGTVLLQDPGATSDIGRFLLWSRGARWPCTTVGGIHGVPLLTCGLLI